VTAAPLKAATSPATGATPLTQLPPALKSVPVFFQTCWASRGSAGVGVGVGLGLPPAPQPLGPVPEIVVVEPEDMTWTTCADTSPGKAAIRNAARMSDE